MQYYNCKGQFKIMHKTKHNPTQVSNKSVPSNEVTTSTVMINFPKTRHI